MQEIWKDIPGYEGIYQASNTGKIRSVDRIVHFLSHKGNPKTQTVKGKILSQRKSFGRYYSVKLCKPNNDHHTMFVHRLVAMAFIPNPKNLEQVNHKDGNIYNNNVDNLEWVTMSQNVNHAYKSGLNFGLKYELSPHNRPVLQFDKNGLFVKRWISATEAAETLGCYKQGIYQVCTHKNKTHFGYIWKYEDE